MLHPATLELIERVAELVKHLGAAISKWVIRYRAEPPDKRD